MNSATELIAPLVQSFFTDHLVRQRRASPQTVASYRDTFRLLIPHLSQTTGRKPSDLSLDDLQAKAIMRFLDGIEQDRGNSVQTRNARLVTVLFAHVGELPSRCVGKSIDEIATYLDPLNLNGSKGFGFGI
jgi:site-specific recombinase XerD